ILVEGFVVVRVPPVLIPVVLVRRDAERFWGGSPLRRVAESRGDRRWRVSGVRHAQAGPPPVSVFVRARIGEIPVIQIGTTRRLRNRNGVCVPAPSVRDDELRGVGSGP